MLYYAPIIAAMTIGLRSIVAEERRP